MFSLRWQRALEFFVVSVLAFLVLLPASPLVQKLPSWDSGVFLYTGWRVTAGALPYRDVWDHKPPLIFVINAVGLWLSGGSRWGVWALEVVALTIALWLAFDLVRRAFGTLTAWYVVCAVLVNAFLAMDGGNYTTEYALPFQFAMLWLIATAPREMFSVRRAFVLGILSALLFWLKQNDIGIPLAFGLYLLARLMFSSEKRHIVQIIGAMLAGAFTVSAIVIFPFVLQNALAEFWDAAFLFNFVYIDETWLDRFLSLRFVPVALPAMGLTLLATMGWLTGALLFVSSARERGFSFSVWQEKIALLRETGVGAQRDAFTTAQVSRLLAIALLALPFELVLASISDNGFGHYFLALLPIWAILAAFFFSMILVGLERVQITTRARAVFVFGVILVAALFAAENIQSVGQRLRAREHDAIIEYIRAHTSENDTLYIWGGESRINFETRRRAATRFVYASPVVRRNYVTEARVQDFLAELMQQPPRLLIDIHEPNRPFMEFPIQSEKIHAAVQTLSAMYQERATVDGWTIYELRAQ